MKRSLVILLGLVQFIHQSLAFTAADIETCESASASNLFIQGQCVDCSQNCTYCNGSIKADNTCQLPSYDQCLIPGFLYNSANVCQDCRLEENCLKNCDGYWNVDFGTCLRQINKTYQVLGGALCIQATSEQSCRLCSDQHYFWSNTTQTCLKCPSMNWNSTSKTCSALSECSISKLEGLDATGSCSNCSSSGKYLDKYSVSCENCPSMCTQCGGLFAQCDSSACPSPYTSSTDSFSNSFCECKGSNYYDGTNCNPCPTNCAKCKSDGTCVTCSNGYSKDKISGLCVDCAVMTSDSQYCEIPAFAHCKQLTADKKYCNVCEDGLVYDSQLRYCVCTDGKMYNTDLSKCVYCSDLFPNCSQCTNKVCTLCNDNSFSLAADQKSCSCTGFSKNGLCVPCSTNLKDCQTCDISGQKCSSCTQYNGLDSTTSQCYSCKTIDANCISCDGNKLCSSCTNGFTLSASKKTCDCTSTSSALLNNFCYLCQSSLSNCNKCKASTDGKSLVCTECASPYVISNGVCALCSAGFYRENGACVACQQSNCKQCSSLSCYSCQNAYTLNSNNQQCDCLSPFVVDPKTLECKSCAALFSTPLCTDCSATACTTCSGTGFTPNTTGCACIKGVLNTASNICLPCSSNCIKCSTSDDTTTSCQTCDTGYNLQYDNTCIKCTAGQYYDLASKSCKNCNDKCSACPDNMNGGSCSACSNNYQLVSGNCVCTGKFVLQDSTCVTCATKWGPNCDTCNDTQCLTCASNYYLKNSNKTCIQCSAGQYFKQDLDACTDCGLKCNTCTGLTGLCTGTCSDNYDLNSTTGVCECTKAKIISADSCLTCSSLIPNCSECSSTTTCTKCNTNYKLFADGSCQQCTQKTYYDSVTKSCKSCGIKCNGCADDTGLCTLSCSDNYKIENGICVCTTDRSLDNNQNCLLCGGLFNSCLECSSNACTKCSVPFVLTDKGQCRECNNSEIYLQDTKECKQCKYLINNCLSCSSPSICTECVGKPFQLSSTKDKCLCPTGNYLVAGDQANMIDDQCIACSTFDQNCLQCPSQGTCSLCGDGYAFDSTLSKCRNCYDTEYYDNRLVDQVQQCVNCNNVHEQCIKCDNATTCTQCQNNFDAKNATCACNGNKILLPSSANAEIMECQMCTVIDPLCDLCSDATKCDKCISNYRWDDNYKRCIPDITLTIITDTPNTNKAISDKFNLSLNIPSIFEKSQLQIKVYFFDSKVQYDSEVQLLKSQKVEDEAIPFSLSNCVVYADDDLSILPTNNYLKVGDETNYSFQKKDTFLLHEGEVIFIYSVQSKNQSFVRYSVSQNVVVTRTYLNMKDLSFAIGRIAKNLSEFSLFQVFNQILLQQNEICTSDSQCSDNGICIPQDKICKCTGSFTLFDCSDYVTAPYDMVLQQISDKLVLDTPTNYQQEYIKMNIPLVVSQSAAFNQAGIAANLYAIRNIMKGESIDNNEKDDIQNLMKNIMNNVSSNIKEFNTDFTVQEVQSTLNELKSITEQLLPSFGNSVSFGTDSMQLLAKISNDPTKIVANVIVEDAFNPNYVTDEAIITNSDTPSNGAKIKVVRYAFKENPHKLSASQFQSQPSVYPLVIVNSYQAQKRILQASNTSVDVFAPISKNFTFIFKVPNASKLKNLICLTLESTSSDKYQICDSKQVDYDQVTCNCMNSATVYEDVHYNYLPKPDESKKNSDHIPTSMIIAVSILSILLAFLIFVQIKNYIKDKKEQASKAATQQAQEASQNRNQQQQDGNQNLKGNYEASLATQQYNNKTEAYEQVFQNSPGLHAKDIKLNLFENSPTKNKNDDDSGRDNFEFTPQNQCEQMNAKNKNSVYDEEQQSNQYAKNQKNMQKYESVNTPQ